MPRELKLVLRETLTGRETTPWLDLQREKFSRVAKECREHFQDSKLRGEAKVRAMNAWMSQHLRDADKP